MQRIPMWVLACFVVCGVAAAGHGDFDHVRGTVTQIGAQTIVVETQQKATKTLTIDAKTTFKKGGQPATLQTLKVGDRIVADVRKGTLEAELIQIGAPAPKPAASSSTSSAGK